MSALPTIPCRFIAIAALAIAAGCRSDTAAAESMAPHEAQAAPTSSTLVRGRVSWEGEIPDRRVFDLSGNPDCSRERKEPLLDEAIVVHSDRAVESVLLFVDLPAMPSLPPPPPTKARMESRGCCYVPHVLAIQAGQSVEFVQTDRTLLNVHLLPAANDEQNFAMPQAGGRRAVAFPKPEPFFVKVKGEVHPWMSAWIAVLPHPWFAVTSADGRYAIERVPPGRHELVLRHPRLGEQRVEIDVVEGTSLERDFVLRAPTR
jgi:hypothetical protein